MMAYPFKEVEIKNYLTEAEAGEKYLARKTEKESKLVTTKEWLKNFHQNVKENKSYDFRLQALKQAAEIVADRGKLWPAELRLQREAFDRVKNNKFPISKNNCFVCNNKSEHRHHIIQLQNGGPATLRENVVFLCRKCHEWIHPWLLTDERTVVPEAKKLIEFTTLATNLFAQAARGRFTSDFEIEEAEADLKKYFRSVINILKQKQ